MLAIPVLDKLDFHFTATMFQAINTAQTAAINVRWNHQDSLVSRSRNTLFSDWLFRSDEEFFLFIDSDIELPQCRPEWNMIDMLVDDMHREDVDIVGGLYSVKAPGANRSSSVALNFGGTGVPEYNTGLHEMLWLSTGCFMVKRTAAEKMVQKYPELLYQSDGRNPGQLMFGAFVPFIVEVQPGELPGVEKICRKYLSEDWAFCQRAHALGLRIWDDSRILCRHWGSAPFDLYSPKPPAAPSDKPDLSKINAHPAGVANDAMITEAANLLKKATP
jgi:hypothetical protein